MPDGEGTKDAVPVSKLLGDDVAFDDAGFRARWGGAFLLVDVALSASPFDLDGTLPGDEPRPDTAAGLAGGPAHGPAGVKHDAVVYLLQRRVAAPDRPITLGRTEATDVVLNDRSVSKLHAFLEPMADGRLQVQDAGSKNGTWIAGARLAPPPRAGSVLVEPGDVVMFGTVRARYLDVMNLRALLGAHPDRPVPVGRTRVERPVSDDSGRNVLQAAVDVLDAVQKFREQGVELGIRGGAKTLTDMERPDIPSTPSSDD